jgi:hypothetical protein
MVFPNIPEGGERLVMDGAATTVKLMPFVVDVPTVTVTFPVTAEVGTVTPIAVGVHELKVVAVIVPNFTVPGLDPKPLPFTVKVLPTAPEITDRLVIAITVKLTPLLGVPTVTTTFPEVAPVGTLTCILLALQLAGTIVAATPLNLTVLVPGVDPKPLPKIVTVAPITPDVGDRLVIDGAANIWGQIARNIPMTASLMLFIIPPREQNIAILRFDLKELTVDK